MRKLGGFLVTVGLAGMLLARFADALGLGGTAGVGADQWLAVLLGAGLLGLGLILLLTPGDFDFALPPEPRVVAPPLRRRRSAVPRFKHVRHH